MRRGMMMTIMTEEREHGVSSGFFVYLCIFPITSLSDLSETSFIGFLSGTTRRPYVQSCWPRYMSSYHTFRFFLSVPSVLSPLGFRGGFTMRRLMTGKSWIPPTHER
jgi:hypothetical protein